MYNERYFFRESLQRLLKIADSTSVRKTQIIIVDDCSTDLAPGEIEGAIATMPTKIKDTEFSYEIHRHKKNSGKGKALQTGIQACNGDITVVHDADLEYDPVDIIKIVDVFISKNADVVYGSRFLPSLYKRVLYFRHQLGNKLITFLVDLATDLNLTDVETCYKAVRTELLKSIPLHSTDFCIEVELTIKLAQREAKFYEVPISYNGRTYEEGKKINWKDGVRTLFAILRYTFTDDIYITDDLNTRLISMLSRAKKYNKYTAELIKPHLGDSVLELASGVGSITRKLLPKTNYFATENNPLYLNALQNLRESRPFLRVSYLDIQHLEDSGSYGSFDSIICINIVEHSKDDKNVMKNIYGLLNPGGSAVILVPNCPFLFSRLDKKLGHYRRYSRKTLIGLAEETGFKLKKIIPLNRLGSLAWLISAKILRKRKISRMQLRTMDHSVPILKLIDKVPLLPPLSLIGIFTKE